MATPRPSLPVEQKGNPNLEVFSDIKNRDIERRSVSHASLRGRIQHALALVEEAEEQSKRAWESHAREDSDEAERYCKLEAVYTAISESIQALQFAQINCMRLGNFRSIPINHEFFESTNNSPQD